jgi:3-hydroxyacyl-CoA dehydrogenase
MTDIKKIAVLGSGVMGSGIAALAANAGLEVILMDIVPAGAEDRNQLAKAALEKQGKGAAPGFSHAKNAKRVRAANFEDDLKLLAECDWIIEAVLEKIEVKQEVYRKVEAVRKDGSIVSSNTSTLPLHVLTEGMPARFAQDFCIAHFFNPPRFMRLLEMLPSPKFDAKRFSELCDFADRTLGKGIVVCKDTPGFLANRIGVYWMTVGLLEAIRLNIPVEAADAVMGKPLGMPKTGMFGLYDLIGIDLMPLIAKAMLATLPAEDAFRKTYALPGLVEKMIAEGYTGRKGKGGFYRLQTSGGKKAKEAIDLATGEYRPENKPKLESVEAAKAGLAALFMHPDIGGQYAASVMGRTLHYAASLVPEISDDIQNIDDAMRLGYNWKYGPFELIDRMKAGGKSGVENFALLCGKLGLEVPPLIAEAQKSGALYREEKGAREQFAIGGKFTPVRVPAGSLMLEDIKRAQKPIAKNPSAQLWDLGDGVACLELTSKQNTFDPENLKFITETLARVKQDFKGLVIGTDADHFSFGANIGFFLLACNSHSWWAISDMVTQGQQAFMGLKYAPFPVVSALSGMALGGGCELQLHVDAVQAHLESYPGLVEAGIGVIPGWGGCKELVWRHMPVALGNPVTEPSGPMPGVSKAFEYISLAKVAGSAQEAQEMRILNAQSGISMNRRRVLADAKARCLQLAKEYAAPEKTTRRLPGATGATALQLAVDNAVAQGKAMPHDVVVSKILAHVLTGGNTDITQEVTEEDMLKLEHDGFMELCKTEATRLRIAHMLETSKPLRN